MWWTRRDERVRRPRVGGRAMRRPRGRWIPRAEPLENRTLLAVVTSLADDGTAGTLRSVIAAAQAGNVITFAAGLAGKTILLNPANGPLVINTNLTIMGPGNTAAAITIDGQKKIRIFQIAANTTVSLADMTITDGSATALGGGGGIYSQGNLTVTNSAVTDNTYTAAPGQTAAGGGIDNFQGTLTIVKSTVSGNSAMGGVQINGGNGGTFNAGGGGIASVQGNLTITSGSKITNNFATGGLGFILVNGVGPAGNAWGGGVYEARATLTISGSTISGNYAIGGLGVINAGGRGGNGDGGGIYDDVRNNVNAPLSVSTSLITGNNAIGGFGGAGAPGAAGANGGNGGRGGFARGGGIWVDAGSTFAGPLPSKVVNSIVSNNLAMGGDGGMGGPGGAKANGGTGGDGGSVLGGGIFNQGLNTQQALVITATAITSNRAYGGNAGFGGPPGAGGAVGIDGDGGGGRGAGIAVNNGAVTITAGIVLGNYAVGGFGDVGGDGEGGGIAVFAGTTTINFSIVSSNEAVGGPGAVVGSGLGGGLFIDPAAVVSGATTTLVAFNLASTKDNNVSGPFAP